MRLINRQSTPCHLGYCTNIHAGEQWHEVLSALQQYVPAVKQRVSPDAAFGLGLRASMCSIQELQKTQVRNQFKQWLKDEDAYVYTVNGFPYGAFHATQVKADVYRPDWSSEHRLRYTCAIADVLADLGPPDNFATISTVPCTFREWANTPSIQAIIHNLLSCVAHCMHLQQGTGVTVAVALEPEPACFLETVDDVIAFFSQELYSQAAIKLLARLSNTSHSQAESALHRHLGICYDICHAAVEFEDPVDGIARMQNAGIPVLKLQLSSALRVAQVEENTLAALQCFDEPVYLHQVVERVDGRINRFHDLPLAIAAHSLAPPDTANGKEWRIHFHVPVFLSALEHFDTTRDQLAKVLEAHARCPLAPHLEVETYTWDVLPEQYRNVPVDQAIARELDWVLGQLDSQRLCDKIA